MLFLGIALTFVACQNNDDATDLPEITQELMDVTFDLTNYGSPRDAGSKTGIFAKESATDIPECSDLDPDYVHVKLEYPDGEMKTHFVDIIANGETMETEVLKLPEGEYTILEFAVFNNNGTTEDDEDDIALYTSPVIGSYYQVLWDLDGIEKGFIVEKFVKKKVTIDVLCYIPEDYENFGFVWFQYAKYRIKHVCFFGNICTKFFEEFHTPRDGDNNPYIGQFYDGYDFAAIFRVDIKNEAGEIVNDPLVSSNAEWYGTGEPLCIEFLDNLQILDEIFFAEIWLALPDGSEILLDTIEFNENTYSGEDAPIKFGGEDGIYDFNVGNCLDDDSLLTDAVYTPYIPLPDQVLMTVDIETNKSYVNVNILQIFGNPPGNQIMVGTMQGWCADRFSNIFIGVQYLADVYSSLNIVGLPPEYAAYGNKWNVLNWIINTVDIEALIDAGDYTSEEIQNGIWALIHDNPGPPDVGSDGGFMASLGIDVANQAAIDPDISNYVPGVGDWAFVLLDPVEGDQQERIQLIIVQVDP